MKHLFASLFIAAAALSAPMAQAQTDWEIRSFHADITVEKDGSIDVKETIETDFNVEKHGIYRDIPVKYRNTYNQDVSLDFSVVGVTDEDGSPIQYEASRDGAYEHIKIGDPDRTITGPQTYVIEYRADRGLRYFNDHDELYWNVTGTEWEVPISQSSATIHLPFTDVDGVDTICYTGPSGSTAQDCTSAVNSGSADFTAQDFLTVAVSWPKGLVDAPSLATKTRWFVSDNIGFSWPILAFALGYWIWSRRGRDPKGRGIVRQYEAPDKLSPSETAYLVNQRLGNDSISAEIIWLANKGYIKIKEIEKKTWIVKSTGYELERTSKVAADLKPHQNRLLNAIFDEAVNNKITISDLPTDFYKDVNNVKDAVWSSMEQHKYFVGKPDNISGAWIIGAFVIGGAMFFSAAIHDFRVDMLIGTILSTAILIIFAVYMPKRTEAGVAAYEYALGFKQYIDGAETERVKWEEKENLFFDVLPFAMAFGIAEKWAKAFEGKLTQPPQWYSGTNPMGFSPVRFNSSLSAFSSATSSHSSPPSSNSSGFSGGSSGGGGGGGGGGSW